MNGPKELHADITNLAKALPKKKNNLFHTIDIIFVHPDRSDRYKLNLEIEMFMLTMLTNFHASFLF